jgi:FMN phosphatase YigB (HAD superfamily)/ribulose-5-phosphate 4-epimerase/fuculose-1-phosphate aldolase
MIEGILFDMDGTLYDYDKTNTLTLESLFTHITQEHNKLTYHTIKETFTSITKNIKSSCNYACKFNKSIYIKQLVETLQLPLTYIDKYIHLYNTIFSEHLSLYTGVIELFQYLYTKKIKIGIISNNKFEQQYQKLVDLDVIKYINVIQTSDETGYEKPHSSIFLQAIYKMKMIPEHIMYVGDNMDHDIIPSIQFGMLACFFTMNNNPIQYHKKYIQCSSYDQLFTFIKSFYKSAEDLVFLSHYFGQSVLTTQGPGGNISIKQDDLLFIKSSGSVLGNMTITDGYCIAHNPSCLDLITTKDESASSLCKTKIMGTKPPSMETFFHSFMKQYTVHVHFTLVNRFSCLYNKESFDLEDFPYKYQVIDYIPPGLLLADKIKEVYSKDIDVYFLLNHGIILTGDIMENILIMFENIYNYFNTIPSTITYYHSEWTTFVLSQLYYQTQHKSIVIRTVPLDIKIITPFIYCVPDMSIFIEHIMVVNTLEEVKENLERHNHIFQLICINDTIYACADTLSKLYYIIELLEQYKNLYEYSLSVKKKLLPITDTTFLHQMELEKSRKL